jgi:hypothetical protein
MSNLREAGNTLQCGLSGVFGTGSDHCAFNFKNMSGGGFGLIEKNTVIPDTYQELADLRKTGKFTPFQGTVSMVFETAADQRKTYDSGVEVDATLGLITVTATFASGLMFNRVLASYRSQNRYKAIFWDAAGNILRYQDKNGIFKGYTLGRFSVDAPKIAAQGGEVGEQMVSMQLINREEFDRGVSFVDADQIDDSILELEGVNELVVSLNPVADGDATITGKIVSAWDSKLTNAALTEADLAITGATASAATVSAAGVLSITVTAVSTDDVITVALDGVVEDVDGRLFKSNVATTVVTV